MVLSLFARRTTLGATAFVADRTAHPAALSVVMRRPLFTTPQFKFPPARASQEDVSREPSEKKALEGQRASLVKRGRPPKEQAEDQGKQPKQEKQAVRIPKHLKPPKRAPGPFVLFYSSLAKSQPQGGSLQDFQALIKRASGIWNGYSMAERQPFYDESEARRAQARQEKEDFFRNTSPSDLKQLNAIRKAQGKRKFHSTRKSSAPPGPFILFSNEFRNSPDGHAILNGTSSGRAVGVVRAAADRWNSMSTEEKAPYLERFKKAKEEWKVEHID